MFGLPPMATEWLGAGVLFVVAGYFIKFHQWTFLLSGYDKTSPVPDEVIADVAGNTILRLGLASVALGAIVTFADPPSYLSTVFEAVILVAVVRLLYRLHTYTPANAA